MARSHTYRVRLDWTGNQGQGTATAESYSRAHTIRAPGKPPIAGSSDPGFRGDARCWNPEELLLASLSACHQLWYLGLCAGAGIVVVAYEDDPDGTMVEEADDGGRGTAPDGARAVLHRPVRELCGLVRAFHLRRHRLVSIGLSEAVSWGASTLNLGQ